MNGSRSARRGKSRTPRTTPLGRSVVLPMLVLGWFTLSASVAWSATAKTFQTRPAQVPGLSSGVSAVVTGYYHTCATVRGALKCWGRNDRGQLGTGDRRSRSVPSEVSRLSSDVAGVVAGAESTCAVIGGGVRCWGEGLGGTLGDGRKAASATPVTAIPEKSGVSALFGGPLLSCARFSGEPRRVRCWGYWQPGMFEAESLPRRPLPKEGPTRTLAVPQDFRLNRDAVSVSLGLHNGCVVAGGGVACWGSNLFGALGNGRAIIPGDPATRESLSGEDQGGALKPGSGATTVAGGSYRACAVVNGGARACPALS